MHRTRRVVCRDVERLEVVPVVLDFGPFLDREARVAEQRLDATARARDRVQAARLLPAPRQGDVDAACREPTLELGAVEFGLARVDGRGEFVAHGVDAGAGGLALVGRERAQGLELRCDGTLLAEELDLERLEVGQGGGRGRARPGVGGQGFESGGRGRIAHAARFRLAGRLRGAGSTSGDSAGDPHLLPPTGGEAGAK